MDDSAEGQRLFCAKCRRSYAAAGRKRNQASRNQVRSTIDSQQWKFVRKQVIARDGNICQNHRRNGYPLAISGQQLQLDHICPQEARPDRIWDLTNLEMLCLSCHGRKTRIETFGTGIGEPLRITWDFHPNLWVAPVETANPKRIEVFRQETEIEAVIEYQSTTSGVDIATNSALILVPDRFCFAVGSQIRARFHRFLSGFNN